MIWLQIVLIFIIVIVSAIFSMFTENTISEKTHSRANSTIFIFSFIAFTAVLFLRFTNIGLLLLDIGIFLNMAVILANKGYMPVDINALKRLVSLYEPNLSDEMIQKKFDEIRLLRRQHIIMSNDTKFNILGDKYGHSVQSIGDIFIYTGLILVVFETVFRILLAII